MDAAYLPDVIGEKLKIYREKLKSRLIDHINVKIYRLEFPICIKDEEINELGLTDIVDARRMLDEYLQQLNSARPDSALHYVVTTGFKMYNVDLKPRSRVEARMVRSSVVYQ